MYIFELIIFKVKIIVERYILKYIELKQLKFFYVLRGLFRGDRFFLGWVVGMIQGKNYNCDCFVCIMFL